MQDRLSISVVIVNYNSGEYLYRCLESLIASDILLEVVVVDNASQDNSYACVEALDSGDHQVKLISNSENIGFAAAVNIGVAETSSDVVVLLNPDSTVHADSIRVLTNTLVNSESAAITGGLVFNEDGTEQNGCRRREPDLARGAHKSFPLLRFVLGESSKGSLDMSREPLPSTPVPVDAVSGSFMAIQRSVLEEIGGMDSDYFLHCEDLDICRTVRDRGYQVMFIPQATIFHQQGISGGSYPYRVEWYKRNGMLRYFNKHQARKNRPWQRVLVSILVTAHFARSCFTLFVKRLFANSEYQPIKKSSFGQSVSGCTKTILVTGATSVVGSKLIDRLVAEKYNVIALSRSKMPKPGNNTIQWFNVEYLDKVSATNFPTIHAMIHLAPIWTLPKLLPQLSRLRVDRIIAISSTSIMAKKTGTDRRERHVAELLASAENAANNYAAQHQLKLTILRATMIYDGANDQNISKIIRFIRRFGFFPLSGTGAGLRQPVHIDDVVAACLQSIDNSSASGQTYTIGGKQVLPYKNMVDKLFKSLGKNPKFLSLPVRLMRFAMSLIAKIIPWDKLSPAMIDRMQENLCYSHERASRDFAYAPRSFSIQG